MSTSLTTVTDPWSDPWNTPTEPVDAAADYAVPATYTDESGTERKITRDANGIPRDQWKRPVICKADGTWAGYTRISTIAKELDKGEGLKHWSVAMTAIGMVITPELFCEVADLIDGSDNPYADHSSRLIALAGQAQEAAGSTIKRELGTTLHEWAQILDRTGDLSLIPEEHLADITAYQSRTAELRVLESEVFVVVDEIEAAGSLDKLVTDHDGVIRVGDVKTGQNDPRYPMAVEMQVAAYARGARYDLGTGERTPLHPDGVDLDEGVLIHMPSGSGTCQLYPLNLRRGWDNLLRARDLREARKAAGRKLKPRVPATSLVGV